MEIEKFEQAKKVKEEIDRLERQKYKMESALKSCSLGAQISFTHSGAFRREDEVKIFNTKIIKEMLNKELEEVNSKIEETKVLFEEL